MPSCCQRRARQKVCLRQRCWAAVELPWPMSAGTKPTARAPTGKTRLLASRKPAGKTGGGLGVKKAAAVDASVFEQAPVEEAPMPAPAAPGSKVCRCLSESQRNREGCSRKGAVIASSWELALQCKKRLLMLEGREVWQCKCCWFVDASQVLCCCVRCTRWTSGLLAYGALSWLQKEPAPAAPAGSRFNLDMMEEKKKAPAFQVCRGAMAGAALAQPGCVWAWQGVGGSPQGYSVTDLWSN